MSVFLRLRPLLGEEKEGDVKLDPDDETKVRCQSSAKNGTRNGTFTFSRIFSPEVDNYTLYGEIISSLVHNVHTGRQNSLVMAYGVTNSGKTHTIIGKGEDKDEGILLLALKEICSKSESIQALKQSQEATGGENSTVEEPARPAASLTIVEITLGHRNVETWRDLLSDNNTQTLRYLLAHKLALSCTLYPVSLFTTHPFSPILHFTSGFISRDQGYESRGPHSDQSGLQLRHEKQCRKHRGGDASLRRVQIRHQAVAIAFLLCKPAVANLRSSI
jgi:hypothetical protein